MIKRLIEIKFAGPLIVHRESVEYVRSEY